MYQPFGRVSSEYRRGSRLWLVGKAGCPGAGSPLARDFAADSSRRVLRS